MTERRPRLIRACPVPGCDWVQVTSWYIGGPGTVEDVAPAYLRIQAEDHMRGHAGPRRPTIVT
ncbi:hypothetical protein SPI1_4 [Skermania phage SPI1]|nr:hypothetical protein SPI1_4 [Skermania phage SPI1]